MPKKVWGGEFWTDGYFASTVGKDDDENMIAKYMKNQRQEYTNIYKGKQLEIF